VCEHLHSAPIEVETHEIWKINLLRVTAINA